MPECLPYDLFVNNRPTHGSIFSSFFFFFFFSFFRDILPTQVLLFGRSGDTWDFLEGEVGQGGDQEGVVDHEYGDYLDQVDMLLKTIMEKVKHL